MNRKQAFRGLVLVVPAAATSAVISGGHTPKKGTDWVKNTTNA